MKTELRNVLFTFTLVGMVSLGIAQLHRQQEVQLALTQNNLERTFVETEMELDKIYNERIEVKKLEALRIAEEEAVAKKFAEEVKKEIESQALLTAQNAAEAEAIKASNVATEAARLVAAQQAIAEVKRQADLLAAEQAAAKLAAEKAAKQKAAEIAAAEAAAAAKKSSRRSRAS